MGGRVTSQAAGRKRRTGVKTSWRCSTWTAQKEHNKTTSTTTTWIKRACMSCKVTAQRLFFTPEFGQGPGKPKGNSGTCTKMRTFLHLSCDNLPLAPNITQNILKHTTVECYLRSQHHKPCLDGWTQCSHPQGRRANHYIHFASPGPFLGESVLAKKLSQNMLKVRNAR